MLYPNLSVTVENKGNLHKIKKRLWPLSMVGAQLSQGYRVSTRSHFTFYPHFKVNIMNEIFNFIEF